MLGLAQEKRLSEALVKKEQLSGTEPRISSYLWPDQVKCVRSGPGKRLSEAWSKRSGYMGLGPVLAAICGPAS